MKESGFWRKLRPLMKEAAPGIVVERIESWSTPGFPDVSGCWKGRDFWLELKIVSHHRIKMRPGQTRWLERRWKAGSRCYVLAWHPNDSISLYEGSLVRSLDRTRWYKVEHHQFWLHVDSVRRMLEVVCFDAKV